MGLECEDVTTMLQTIVRAHTHTHTSDGSRIFERGFPFQLDKTPAQFELKTKKKVINLHTSLSAVFYIYYWMISNKTTVIGAS